MVKKVEKEMEEKKEKVNEQIKNCINFLKVFLFSLTSSYLKKLSIKNLLYI